MIINNNMSAMNAHRQMGMNQTAMQTSMEKLSSGQRINRAGDDAAGLAISEKMRAQISGLDQASRNAQDGISLIQTAEGALDETHSILQRMRELAVQSANDTNQDSVDREAIQEEMDALSREIDRIAENTEFNDQKLLDGDFQNKVFHIGANEGQSIEVSIDSMDIDNLGLAGREAIAAQSGNISEAEHGEGTEEIRQFTDSGTSTTYVEVEGTWYNGADVSWSDDASEYTVDGGAQTYNVSVADGGTDPDVATIAAQEATYGVDVSTQEAANSAITDINEAINQVSTERSGLGAVQNRLEHTISNLDNASENLQAAESRIRDVDMAREMMEFTKNNILSQASQSMLAQANQLPQSVLQLLQ